uniref:Uncharacterized protein n=1 Tax=Pyxicephalus adspersus TaxID=30357 RepID=A0AAV2ZWH2_PYXAD|nr:TPA: hypothetical protein GDO54_003326 [Pyxicephalus adspersus]
MKIFQKHFKVQQIRVRLTSPFFTLWYIQPDTYFVSFLIRYLAVHFKKLCGFEEPQFFVFNAYNILLGMIQLRKLDFLPANISFNLQTMSCEEPFNEPLNLLFWMGCTVAKHLSKFMESANFVIIYKKAHNP